MGKKQRSVEPPPLLTDWAPVVGSPATDLREPSDLPVTDEANGQRAVAFADATDRFINRELSWLDFNGRVLSLAEDPRVPLLEGL